MDHIAGLLAAFEASGKKTVKIAKEMQQLLVSGADLYDDVAKKREVLMNYCETCRHTLSGEKVEISVAELAANLKEKADWMREHIRKTEWVQTAEGDGFFNGYYDNSGKAVEGDINGGVRMMLTSQVFTIMSKTATNEQVAQIVKSADKYLYDASVGGYRLNTDFHEVKMDLGRMFGFAYGHKENGAVFCHMATMFGNALYTRGFAKEAYKVFNTLFEHCNDIEKSRIYPGVPEYVDAKGRGVYHYLTGAASWLLVTVITQMFGVRGQMGDLAFVPQLLPEQFDANGEAGLSMIFHMAFSVKAVGGALCGNIVASMMNAARYGVARGCFSNEAGMGSAAITAAAATTDHPVRQAYINMTGTFWDTIVVCTITGLAIASSGMLGQIDPATGEMYVGSALTIAAFSTVLGKVGGYLVTIGIALFAFSTILGWEYHGEKAFEYLMGTHKFNMIYRIIFSLVAYVGATQTLELVWNFSDIANALMAIPNLICMLLLSGEIAKDVKEFQKTIEEEKAGK